MLYLITLSIDHATYVTSNDRMIDELERMKKGAVVTGTYLEGPAETTKGSSHESLFSSQNSNRVTSQPMARLASTFYKSVIICIIIKMSDQRNLRPFYS
jgi:hypothetical protein